MGGTNLNEAVLEGENGRGDNFVMDSKRHRLERI